MTAIRQQPTTSGQPIRILPQPCRMSSNDTSSSPHLCDRIAYFGMLCLYSFSVCVLALSNLMVRVHIGKTLIYLDTITGENALDRNRSHHNHQFSGVRPLVILGSIEAEPVTPRCPYYRKSSPCSCGQSEMHNAERKFAKNSVWSWSIAVGSRRMKCA